MNADKRQSTALDTTYCYLIRHAATANNEHNPPVLQGRRLDSPLSAAGREQAARAGRFLAARPIAAVYASPMVRAVETARAVAEPHGLTVQTVDELNEADLGVWEGLDWNQIEQQYKDAYEAFMRDAGVNPYLGGETMNDVVDRAGPTIDRLLAENVGRTIAIVAHNVVNRTYLTRLLGLTASHYRSVPQDNACVNLLRFRRGRTKAITVNGVFHLDGHGEW